MSQRGDRLGDDGDNVAVEQEAASTRRQRAILDALPDLVFVLDDQGIFLDCHGAADAFYVEPDKFLGRRADEVLPPEVATRTLQAVAATLKSRTMQKYEYELPIREQKRHFESRMVPSGEREVLAVIREITARRQAQEQVRRLTEELEDRVAARTAQLSAANMELEAFAYSVSHDLRTPLLHIDGFSQAVIEDYGDRLDAQGLHFLQRVREGVRTMQQLIDALLAYSRLTRCELSPMDVALSDVAKTIVWELRQQEPEREVEVELQPDIIVRGDPQLLRAVMDNLLGNAWKFTAKRAPAHISFVELPREPSHPDERVFCVRDNGVGFDGSKAEELFIAFHRLHSAKDYAGHGIGLATVQRIILRHHGRVWAEGAVDQGAAVIFTLPADPPVPTSEAT